ALRICFLSSLFSVSLPSFLLFLFPFFFLLLRPPPRSTLFPYTTLFRSYCSKRLPMSALSARLPLMKVKCGKFASSRRRYSFRRRSEEHTSELQSRFDLVCRLLLEKKKKKKETRREYTHKHQIYPQI